jgi:DNA-binding MarR family transcriptional regulator
MPDRTDPASAEETYNAVISTQRAIKQATLVLVSAESLTHPQYQALREIAKKNGAMLMREISDAMLVTPANVTGIVDRLEEKGLVIRKVSQGDRRATIVELTPEGRAVQERVAKKQGQLVQRALGAFTQDEQRTLRGLLQKLQREISALPVR